MEIHAQLSGLRHIMYHHPWISTMAGVLANILTLTVIILISWSRFSSFEPASPVEREAEWSSTSTEEEDVAILDKPKPEVETVGGWK